MKTVLKEDAFDTFYHFLSSQVSRFVAREKLLRTMEERFSTDAKDSRPKVVAIIGMSGEGKTQLALEFCRPTANAQRFEVFSGLTLRHRRRCCEALRPSPSK